MFPVQSFPNENLLRENHTTTSTFVRDAGRYLHIAQVKHSRAICAVAKFRVRLSIGWRDKLRIDFQTELATRTRKPRADRGKQK